MGEAEEQILKILRQTGGAYQSEIVKATGFSKGTISEALTSLTERRLVRRVAVGKNWMVYPQGEVRQPRRGKRLQLGFTRSAEYPFLVPFKRALREADLDLGFKVYENGIDVARDLSLFRLDLGIAPAVTLFLFHSSEAPIKILAPAGSGGASVVLSPRRPSAPGAASVVTCTKISTMELMMRSAMRDLDIPPTPRVVYASGPSQMQEMLSSGAADVGCLWEPYATILEAQGARRVIRYSEMGEHVCCALAAGSHLDEGLLSRIVKTYRLSMLSFASDPEPHLPGYSALCGLEASALRRVSGEYSYPVDFSGGVVERQFERAGVVLPSPSSFKEALFRP